MRSLRQRKVVLHESARHENQLVDRIQRIQRQLVVLLSEAALRMDQGERTAIRTRALIGEATRFVIEARTIAGYWLENIWR